MAGPQAAASDLGLERGHDFPVARILNVIRVAQDVVQGLDFFPDKACYPVEFF